jgi:hypothetical protein
LMSDVPLYTPNPVPGTPHPRPHKYRVVGFQGFRLAFEPLASNWTHTWRISRKLKSGFGPLRVASGSGGGFASSSVEPDFAENIIKIQDCFFFFKFHFMKSVQ